MKSSIAVTRILTLGVLITLAGFAAAQQAYPNKPIRIIVPAVPGGGLTIVARVIGQKLTESWGQQVLVDNRPGGGSIIASEALVRSPPDGHTVMITPSTHVINPGLVAHLPYDTVKDFAPVATVTRSEFCLVLHPSVPANSLREFIALAKSRRGQFNYASSGTGTQSHLAGELFNIMTGVSMQHIPYKGGGGALPDVIGGQVQTAFMNTITAAPHIRTGQLKAMAITGETRLPVLPQVPTFTEAGLPDFGMTSWYGVLAPAGIPKEIIDKLAAELARIMAMPDIKEKLATLGTEPFISSPDQFAALIKAEIAMYTNIIKTGNIKAEN